MAPADPPWLRRCVEVTNVDLNDAKLTGGADLGDVELTSNEELSDAQKVTPHGARRQRAQRTGWDIATTQRMGGSNSSSTERTEARAFWDEA
jgi:hypothetical protein